MRQSIEDLSLGYHIPCMQQRSSFPLVHPPSFKNGLFLEVDLELLILQPLLLIAETGWEGKETDLYTQFYLTLRDILQSRCGQPISAVRNLRLGVVVLGLRHWVTGNVVEGLDFNTSPEVSFSATSPVEGDSFTGGISTTSVS